MLKKSQIKTLLAEIDRLGAWYLAHKPEAKRRVGNIISKSIDLGITPEQRERAIQEMVR